MLGNSSFEAVLQPLIREARKFLREKFGEPIGVGRNREVYRDGGTVLKLPLSEYGVQDNEGEASRYILWSPQDEHYASCHIEPMYDLPILRMEYVERAKSRKGLPDWVDFIDGFQVGYNKHGKLVAYDYGY